MNNCSELDIPSFVGPHQVFATIGNWLTSVYLILALHAVPVWLFWAWLRLKLRQAASPHPHLQWLICCPPDLMVLTSIGIIAPSLGIFVEILLEIVIVVTMLKYIQFVLHRIGGPDSLVSRCNEENVRLPIGAPPFVCCIPCRAPAITRGSLNFVLLTPVLLLIIKVLILLVEIIFLIAGYEPEREFFALDNLHNLAAIPVGLFGIYGYNMFLIIIPKFVPEKSDTVMGLICLVYFVLFDCTRLFFVFLTGTGMQTCVPPFMSVELVSHFLKNTIKAFLATFIGVPFLTICKDKIEYPSQVDGELESRELGLGDGSRS